MANTTVRTARIPDERWDRLERRANEVDRSVSYELNKAIDFYLDHVEAQD